MAKCIDKLVITSFELIKLKLLNIDFLFVGRSLGWNKYNLHTIHTYFFFPVTSYLKKNTLELLISHPDTKFKDILKSTVSNVNENMVVQLSRVSSVKPNFNYITDVYEVCLDKYLNNKSSSFSSINYGRKILQSEEEVDAYVAFYGAQHFYKLEEAFKALDISKFQPQQLDILSYGCGAATDTCSLISYCRTQKIDLPFKNLTLIEPSKIAL